MQQNGAGAGWKSLRLACHFLCFIEITPASNASSIRAWSPPVTCSDSTVRESALDLESLLLQKHRPVLDGVTAKSLLVLKLLLLVEACFGLVPVPAVT